MKRFFSPAELDYSALMEFLNDLDATFDEPIFDSPTFLLIVLKLLKEKQI